MVVGWEERVLKLNKQKRQTRILAELSSRHAVRIMELANMFEVTPETARRDIEELSQQGLLVRTYGGATLSSIDHEPPARIRAITNTEQRQIIAEQAIKLVENMTVLMIDGGATTLMFAKELSVQLSRHHERVLTVITNSLDIARTLAPCRSIRIILCPGDFEPHENSVYGGRTLEFLSEFHADAVITGACGISPSGITDVHSEAVWVKRQMLKQSNQAILLIDDSKFGANQLERICGLDAIDKVVTNKAIPESILSHLKDSTIAVCPQ